MHINFTIPIPYLQCMLSFISGTFFTFGALMRAENKHEEGRAGYILAAAAAITAYMIGLS